VKIRISGPVWSELHRELVSLERAAAPVAEGSYNGPDLALRSTNPADHRAMVFSSSDPAAIAAVASACKTVIRMERAEADRAIYAPIKTACRRIFRIMTRLLSPDDLRKS
jgi:hypothetical protein